MFEGTTADYQYRVRDSQRIRADVLMMKQMHVRDHPVKTQDAVQNGNNRKRAASDGSLCHAGIAVDTRTVMMALGRIPPHECFWRCKMFKRLCLLFLALSFLGCSTARMLHSSSSDTSTIVSSESIGESSSSSASQTTIGISAALRLASSRRSLSQVAVLRIEDFLGALVEKLGNLSKRRKITAMSQTGASSAALNFLVDRRGAYFYLD